MPGWELRVGVSPGCLRAHLETELGVGSVGSWRSATSSRTVQMSNPPLSLPRAPSSGSSCSPSSSMLRTPAASRTSLQSWRYGSLPFCPLLPHITPHCSRTAPPCSELGRLWVKLRDQRSELPCALTPGAVLLSLVSFPRTGHVLPCWTTFTMSSTGTHRPCWGWGPRRTSWRTEDTEASWSLSR